MDGSHAGNLLALRTVEALSQMRCRVGTNASGKARMRVVQVVQRAIAVSAILTLAAASSATAQSPAANGDYKPLHRIGTRDSLAPRPLTKASDLKTMMMARGMADDIRNI